LWDGCKLLVRSALATRRAPVRHGRAGGFPARSLKSGGTHPYLY
jgi:hypothetical protein